jgi:hypothetical protein
METRQNFTMYAEQDKTVSFDVLDENGLPIEADTIAGARWRVTPEPDRDLVVLEKLLGSGITKADGIITVVIADTDTLPAGTYYHELAIKTTAGDRFPVSRGLVTVLPASTPGGTWA